MFIHTCMYICVLCVCITSVVFDGLHLVLGLFTLHIPPPPRFLLLHFILLTHVPISLANCEFEKSMQYAVHAVTHGMLNRQRDKYDNDTHLTPKTLHTTDIQSKYPEYNTQIKFTCLYKPERYSKQVVKGYTWIS